MHEVAVILLLLKNGIQRVLIHLVSLLGTLTAPTSCRKVYLASEEDACAFQMISLRRINK